jgi:imidazolonepropionase
MIPTVVDQGLAEFIDVFCEKNYFTTDDTQRILEAGAMHGLVPKVHVNQFNSIGGIKVCANNGALTVDHLEILSEDDYALLHAHQALPVALPGCSFFIQIPYTPGRRMIDEGLPLVLASDYNPGSCPSGNMNFVISLACIQMKLTPEEAINAATINGAFAMHAENETGSIRKGAVANLIITKPMKSLALLPYHFGDSPIESVIIKGESI